MSSGSQGDVAVRMPSMIYVDESRIGGVLMAAFDIPKVSHWGVSKSARKGATLAQEDERRRGA